MSTILGAIGMLKQTFDKYAGAEGDKGSLSKKELATLLKAEVPGLADKKEEVDEFMKALDEDGDGSVDFKEYVVFVATLAMILGATK
uniref:Protein S100 n=1 Tax=Cyprinodon variegatus TaxID=28743 RepID=A0A3Q2DJY3_CYPVA